MSSWDTCLQWREYFLSTKDDAIHTVQGEVLRIVSYNITIRGNGAFPLPDSDSYSDYCTDSDSMQKCSTGTDSYGDSYANHGHFASLFEKLIVVSIDSLQACLVIPTTGLYNNFHSFNK